MQAADLGTAHRLSRPKCLRCAGVHLTQSQPPARGWPVVLAWLPGSWLSSHKTPGPVQEFLSPAQLVTGEHRLTVSERRGVSGPGPALVCGQTRTWANYLRECIHLKKPQLAATVMFVPILEVLTSNWALRRVKKINASFLACYNMY